jgi:fatty acid kinase
MSTLTEVPPRLQQRLAARYARVDGHALRQAVEAASLWLRTNQELVNQLNVFPVPDGDTGTNMMLTMQSAWNELLALGDTSLSAVAKAVAQGALLGARGNSGVILSQLWRGIARAIDDQDEIGVDGLVAALIEARDTAYKGVVRPVEGTILTVSKDIAAAAELALTDGVHSTLELLERMVEAADRSVASTPELLPILKQAGVVDSGAKGLFLIIEGILRSAYGLPLDETDVATLPLAQLDLEAAQNTAEPGQDWEVIVDFLPHAPLDTRAFYGRLEEMGTSIQVGEGEGMYRMHIHVPDTTQFVPIEYVQELGTITKVAIENLMIQTPAGAPSSEGIEFNLDNAPPGTIAAIAVAPGPGIARVFDSLGTSAVILGGQTMNPSTQQILSAVDQLPNDQVIVLPNNKNIVMAANQAADLSGKEVIVVPSHSVPQGVAAMLELSQEQTLAANVETMRAALKDVRTGEITVATRTVEIDGVEAAEGQIIGLLEDRLVLCAENVAEVLAKLLEAGEADKAELVTLYYGQGLNQEQAQALAADVRKTLPQADVELVSGGQPHYLIILSIE